MRDSIRSATVHRSQAIVPSLRTIATTPRDVLTPASWVTAAEADMWLGTAERLEEDLRGNVF